MEHQENLLDTLNASFRQQAAIPNLGRWLTTLSNVDLTGLAIMALEGKNEKKLERLTRGLMTAEGLHRPSETRKTKCLQNLGWHALAEYAYRKDWALIGNNPSLLRDARETAHLTPIGSIMVSAMGPASKIASFMDQWSKTNQEH